MHDTKIEPATKLRGFEIVSPCDLEALEDMINLI